VAAGLAYSYSLLDGDSRGHNLRIAMAMQIVEGLVGAIGQIDSIVRP
jgi:hypothetical protein